MHKLDLKNTVYNKKNNYLFEYFKNLCQHRFPFETPDATAIHKQHNYVSVGVAAMWNPLTSTHTQRRTILSLLN